MDPVTHALLGITISEATLRRRVGKLANWLAALAALAPDADTFVGRFSDDPWLSLIVHRGASHSLLVAPLIAAAIGGLFWLFRRKQFASMFALALMATVSHVVLDLFTSYGTQTFWPVSMDRQATDALPIIDFFFTPILAMTVLGCWIARRMKGPPRRPAWIALVGLALAVSYAAAGQLVNVRTQQFALATMPRDHGPGIEVRSGPMIGTVFARRLVVKTPDGYYVARYNMLTGKENVDWIWAPSNDGAFVARADEFEQIKAFRWFAMDMARPVVERSEGNGRKLVRISYYDMRYGYPADSPRSIFVAYVIFDEHSGELLEGPTAPRWSRNGQPAEGLGKFFQPVTEGPVFRGGWLDRFKIMWREAWR